MMALVNWAAGNMLVPTVINFCSTRLDLLRESTASATQNAGTVHNYVVVTWLASPEVREWLRKRPWIHHVEYQTNEAVGYVPNLRGMMNRGFEEAFDMGPWACLINTDVVFARDWLSELELHATDSQYIINSQHITPGVRGKHVINMDLGVPLDGSFNEQMWNAAKQVLIRPGMVQWEHERGGWLNTATMPYLLHRQWWQRCGPWELTGVGRGVEPPDRRFFRRCHEAGAEFGLALGSLVYHYEGIERRSGRPPGAEHLPEEGEVG